MERHSVRGARSDQPTERCRPEARRSESAHFRTGCREGAPPTAAAPSRRKPTRSTQNADALRRVRRHSARSPHTADHSPQPCTNAPPPAPSFTRGAQWSLPPDEKNTGALSRKPPCFREKRGTFLKHTGTFRQYPRSCIISVPTKSIKQQVLIQISPSVC